MINIEFIVIFGITFLVVRRNNVHKIYTIKQNLIIVATGIFNAIMAITMIYSAGEERTPVVMQTIIAGMPIIPAVLFRKLFLNKQVIYEKKYIVPSLILLLTSLTISVIPFFRSFNVKQMIWIMIYITGICFQSGYNVMQEKYITETNDSSLFNKVRLIIFSQLVELVVIISCCWLDKYFGNTPDPLQSFCDSFVLLGTEYKFFLLFHSFILAYMISYILSINLNAISTNYNMITPAISNSLVALFFTIFAQFNIGIRYPFYIIIPCICLSITSIILWIKGERNTDYVPIGNNYDIDDDPINA